MAQKIKGNVAVEGQLILNNSEVVNKEVLNVAINSVENTVNQIYDETTLLVEGLLAELYGDGSNSTSSGSNGSRLDQLEEKVNGMAGATDILMVKENNMTGFSPSTAFNLTKWFNYRILYQDRDNICEDFFMPSHRPSNETIVFANNRRKLTLTINSNNIVGFEINEL